MSDKPFHCNVCDQRFPFKFSVLKHMATHSQSSEQSNWQCPVCRESFRDIQGLEIHKKNECKIFSECNPPDERGSSHFQSSNQTNVKSQLDGTQKPFANSNDPLTANMCTGASNAPVMQIKSDNVKGSQVQIHKSERDQNLDDAKFSEEGLQHVNQHDIAPAQDDVLGNQNPPTSAEMEKMTSNETSITNEKVFDNHHHCLTADNHQEKNNPHTFTSMKKKLASSSSPEHKLLHGDDSDTPASQQGSCGSEAQSLKIKLNKKSAGKKIRKSKTPQMFHKEALQTSHLQRSEKNDEQSSSLPDTINDRPLPETAIATADATHIPEVSSEKDHSMLKSKLMQREGMKTKLFQCDVCQKWFFKNNALTRHAKIHTNIKPFVCDVCGKGFLAKPGLKMHYRTHTGERPYPCTTCGKCFTVKHSLVLHTRIHTGERPFVCAVCGKAFAHISHMKRHSRTHSGERPHLCGICGKTFAQNHTLNQHLRVHTGERPFQCEVCQKSFADQGTYQQHCMIHTGERPYACVVCFKMFRRHHHLKNHLKMHSTTMDMGKVEDDEI